MWQTLLDFVFPKRSLLGREGEWVTREEVSMIRTHPVIMETPRLRALQLNFIDRIVAGASYEDSVLLRKAIRTFKYRRVHGLADHLGQILVQASYILRPEKSLNSDSPILCPVPLHWSRKFARGWNQAEMLSKFVSSARGWPVENLLTRSRPTGSQATRGREGRLTALKNAFAVTERESLPRYVVLIDDLSTTGTTLNECARALKRAGVERVEGLVVAHG